MARSETDDRRLTVAAAHATPVYLNVEATVDKACRLIGEAGAQGVDLLVFPEVFVPGFPYWINCYPPLLQSPLHERYLRTSIRVPGAETVRLCDAARNAGIAAVVGVNERYGSSLYNTQLFIDETGTLIGRHRKLQPTFAERTVWAQGDGSTLGVWPMLGGVQVGGLVCWEHTMNLARHALALMGEQVHAASWPSLSTLQGWETTFDEQVAVMCRNHAVTAQCFVIVAQNPVGVDVLEVMADSLGPQELLTAGGGWSAIIHPQTTVIAGPRTGPEEGLLTTTIDLADIDALKVVVDSAGHYARSDVLRLVLDDASKEALHRTTSDFRSIS
jgi:nitrilase